VKAVRRRGRHAKIAAMVAGTAWSILACMPSDPAWGYVAPQGKPVRGDGVHYEMPVQFGVLPKIHASLFAGKLSLELEMSNVGEQKVTLDSGAFAVRDAAGRKLQARAGVGNECSGRVSASECELAKSQTFRLSAAFNVRPLVQRWMVSAPNPDLRELSVSGLVGRGDTLKEEIHIRLVWDGPT
jgi:hypothetical protein